MNNEKRIELLLAQGVRVPHPESVYVAPDVDLHRIAPGVTLHAGTRLLGADLSIGPDCEIGAEGPATVENCQLGYRVALKGGFFSESVFLDGAQVGGEAHVRPATVLEEEASAAHAVGLKQTIFFPFVTAGSLINFCDALMAGGTSRKNHGEIGSSYIHFNFTPHQDKATASLIGDVPRGVRLDQPPVFLGGQGGMVGPVRIAYGTVVPAGCILRQDILEPQQVYAPPLPRSRAPRPFIRGFYRSLRRVVRNNLIYIGNILALREWYHHARRPFTADDPWRAACVEGVLRALEVIRKERLKRLQETVDRVHELLRSPSHLEETSAGPDGLVNHRRWAAHGMQTVERVASISSGSLGLPARERFLAAWASTDRRISYLEAVRAIAPDVREAITEWLQAIVDAAETCSPFMAEDHA